MLELNAKGLLDRAAWEEKGYILPAFDREAMIRVTMASPRWVHFGAGNIFRAFQCHAVQKLLNAGVMDTGIVAVEGFDYEIMKAIYDTCPDTYIRPDHGRMIWDEQGRPGYGLYDRALGAAYLNGLWEAIEKNDNGENHA